MWIQSTRFGEIEVDDQRVIRFPKGLLGFPSYKHYVLLEAGEDAYFWWLQSVDQPDLAFVVTDPSLFVPTYRVPIREEQMNELGIDRPEDCQVFCIVNKRDHVLTGNLQGPLVIHVERRTGEQLVLSDRRYTTKVPLIELAQPAEMALAQSA
ncbi:MAG: flagellar assembly protein FliW [Planctomycetota bacterium]